MVFPTWEYHFGSEVCMKEKANDTKLVDISTVMTDKDLPKFERTVDYIRQIKDPYHYKSGKFNITAYFPENAPSMEECLQGLMS